MLIETAPAELARSLVNSRAFVTDTARDFTGRAATIAALDKALSDPAFPSGYVVISGEPGVGKTALLCHLVERRGYVHHFTGQAEGTTSPELAVRNLCAQLMLRYDLPGPPSSDLLSQLNEATARARGEPVVILVDALDEAAPAYALYSNPLDLPATLPSGAFIVVTTRSPHQPELTVEQRRDIQLDSSRDDIREYVRRRLPPGVAPRDPESVASLIAELSDGSFLYARYAVDDLIAGRPEREVPWALSALVDDVLSRLRGDDPERFATRYEPLLRSLAYASKPLEYSELAARAGLDPPDVAAAIRALRPLFNEVGERDHIAVSLSHWTLRQYLIEALESHRDLGSPILVAAESAEGLREIGALVGPLTNAEPRREILLVGVVRPPRASRPWRRDPAQEDLRAATSERLDRARSDLIHLGVRCRSVVLEPDEEGRDLARLAVDEAAAFLVLQGRPPSRSDRGSWVAAALRDAPCDVAMLSGRAGVELLTKSSSVIVPFGGAEHDWAALELASSLCAATGASLKLLGAAGAGDEGRSVTRLLADAGLLVQQATGVATEPILVSGGRDGMISAMAGAALVCIGLSDRWEKEGLGSTRAAIADAAPVPILFIRRGNRPGMFAPAGGATQFTWAAVPRPAKPGRGSARS
jgi:nucleotide-binding universal stress UspA family protein